MCWAARTGKLARVRELCEWRADMEAADLAGGWMPLIMASIYGHVEVIRALLAAGANKRRVDNAGRTAHDFAGTAASAPPGSRAAIRALLAAELCVVLKTHALCEVPGILRARAGAANWPAQRRRGYASSSTSPEPAATSIAAFARVKLRVHECAPVRTASPSGAP